MVSCVVTDHKRSEEMVTCEVTVCEWRCYVYLCNMSYLPYIETNQSHPASRSPQWTPTHFVLQCPCKGGQTKTRGSLRRFTLILLIYRPTLDLVNWFTISYIMFHSKLCFLEPTCVQSACSPDTPVLYWAGMSTRWDWPSLDCTSSPGEKTLTVEGGVEEQQRQRY